mgnify:CR=1 FL=1
MFACWIQIGGQLSSQPAYPLVTVDLEEVRINNWNKTALKDHPSYGFGQALVKVRYDDKPVGLEFFEVALIKVRIRVVWQNRSCVVKPLYKVFGCFCNLHLSLPLQQVYCESP